MRKCSSVSQKKKTIYLHIGLPKTGTTALQKSAFKHRDLLKSHGIAIPESGRYFFQDEHGKHLHNVHHVLAWSLIPERHPFIHEDYIHQAMKTCWEDLIKEITYSPQDTIFITSECFSWELVETEDLKTLKKKLSPFRVKVILTLRNVQDLALSTYRQSIFNGDSECFSYQFKLNKQKFSHDHLKNFWGSLCKDPHDLILIDYDEHKKNWIPAFFKTLWDINWPALSEEEQEANASLSNAAYLLIRELNANFRKEFLPQVLTIRDQLQHLYHLGRGSQFKAVEVDLLSFEERKAFPAYRSDLPFVSYLTTVYNKAPYLPATIQALLNQEGDFEREFVFVDDGSTDDSVAVIHHYFENTPYTPIIISQPNQGPARALNTAFAAARGEYLKPMDADDILHPAATRLLLQALEEHQVHVAFCDLHEGEALPDALPADILFTRQRYFRRALKKNIANPSAFLLTRHALHTIAKGGTEGCYPNVFIQDYGLEIRLAFAFEWAYVPAPLVFTPKGEGHLSGNVAQTLHDINAVLASFVAEHGDEMSASDLRFAYKRAAGRAFLWQRRNNGLDGLWLLSFWDFIRSRILPKKRPKAGDFWRTTLPYKKSSNIR